MLIEEVKDNLIYFPGVEPVPKDRYTFFNKVEIWARFSGKVLKRVSNHPAAQVAFVIGGTGADMAINAATGCPITKVGVGLRLTFGLGCLVAGQVTNRTPRA